MPHRPGSGDRSAALAARNLFAGWIGRTLHCLLVDLYGDAPTEVQGAGKEQQHKSDGKDPGDYAQTFDNHLSRAIISGAIVFCYGHCDSSGENWSLPKRRSLSAGFSHPVNIAAL